MDQKSWSTEPESLTEETEESKEFNAMKKQEKKNNSSDRTKAGRRET